MKKFMTIWMGELVSCIGSGMTAFAVSVYVYQLTGSATWVSLTALLAYLPTILLNPVGGILADHYDRRLMMICGDSLSALGLLFIFICIQTGHPGVLPICIGITISSVFAALLEPAYKATVTDLLSEEEYAKASGLVQIAGSSRYLISPLLAGLILAIADIRAILIIDMATFFVTVAAVSSVRKSIEVVKPNKDSFNMYQEFREGIKSITSDKGVSSMVILMGFVCFLVAFLQTLMTPMVLSWVDARTLGAMYSVSAVGMLLGSIVISVLNIKGNYHLILMISLMAAGVFMALTGTTTNIYLIVVFSILFFTALPFVNTSADVLIRLRIPNDVQGRAWGMISVLTQIGYILAYAVGGVLADYVFGPMLMKDGILAGSIGRLIGTGEGRGIGLMLIIAGILMFSFAFIFTSQKSIQEMERRKDELVTC